MKKRGELFHQVIVHLILTAIILAVFIMATSEKVNARGVRQQVLEKQTALLIDSAIPGMSIEIQKNNINGYVSKVKIENCKIYVVVAGLNSIKGYPYFSRYSVSVREELDKFLIEVK